MKTVFGYLISKEQQKKDKHLEAGFQSFLLEFDPTFTKALK